MGGDTVKRCWWLLLFHVAAIPVTISLAEGSGFLLALVGIFLLVKHPSGWKQVPRSFTLPVCFFIVYTAGLALSGLQPDGSGHKLYRFLAFGTAVSVPMLVSFRSGGLSDLQTLLGAYLLGAAFLGVTDILRVPMELRAGTDLFDTGNMRDPQFYMTAILLAVGSGIFLLPSRPRVGCS